MRGRSGELARSLELVAGSGTVAGLSDAELLQRFAARCERDRASAEVAFGAIVARHGTLVLGVCRHVLREPSDVDDAFQATFLVLVRKANAVRVKESLAPWLHGVAYRTAIKARSLSAKRRNREAEIVRESNDEGSSDDHAVLHEELNRLPEKYRSPVVLCHLEGLSHEEAARQLRWPVGTVSGRLSRARDLLRDRLTRRGLSASVVVAMLASTKAEASVPRSLLESTVQSAATLALGGSLSGTVWILTQGVLSAMLWNKLKVATLAVLAIGSLAVGGGYAFSQGPSGQPTAAPAVAETPKAEAAARPEPKKKGVDQRRVNGQQPGMMGGGMMSAGMMGGPPQPSIAGSVNGSIVVAHGKEKNKVWATSLNPQIDNGTFGRWQAFTAPEGAEVSWTTNNRLLATSQYDVTVKELAVFCADMGKWMTTPLKTQDQEVHGPYLCPSSVVYVSGKFAYGYSAKIHVWNVVDLKAEGTPMCISSPSATLLQQGGLLYVYNPESGAWTTGVEVGPERDPQMGELDGKKDVPGGMNRPQRLGGMR